MRKFLVCCILIILNTYNGYTQIDTTREKLSFDLGITRGGNLRLWPIVKITREDELKDLQLLFTLFQKKKNVKDNAKHSHFLPLFWSDSNKNVRDFRLLTTYYPSVFSYKNNYRKQYKSYKFIELAPEISLLEFTKTKDGNYLKNNAFFFLWYKNDKIKKQCYFVTFPLYWYFNNKDKKTNTFFPLYSYGKYNKLQDKYYAITPLFWHFRTKQNAHKTMFFPLFFHQKYIHQTDTYFRSVLFPLFWRYKDLNYNNNVFFPLVWSYKNNVQKNLVVFPLYAHGKQYETNNRYTAVTPFFWHVNYNHKKTNILFPFWLNSIDSKYKNARKGIVKKKYIFPWYYSQISHNKNKIYRSFFPFYWHRKLNDNNSYYIFPFILKKQTDTKQYFAIFPFYSATNFDNKSSNYKQFSITPFYQHKTNKSKFNHYSRNILFPFYWHKKDTSYTYSKKDSIDNISSYKVIFPLYWHYKDTAKNRNSKVVFPFVWQLSSGKYKSFAIMPFFSKGHSLTNSTKKHFAVSPLYWHFEDGDRIGNYFYPIWWHKKQKNKSANVIFPLWWSYNDTFWNTRSRIFFPFVWDIKSRHYKAFVTMPFYGKGSSLYHPDRKFYAVTPLFWHIENNKSKQNYLFPIWYNSSQPDKKRNIIFPIWWSNRHYDKSYKVLFPLWWSFADTTHNTYTKVLFPLVFDLKNNYYRSFTFFPFFSKGQTNNGNQKHLAITPLFWKLHDGSKKSTLFLPLYWRSVDTALNIARTTLFPIYWHKKNKHDTFSVYFPLGFRAKGTYNKTHLIFPFYLRNNYLKTGAKLTAISPLFWHYHSKYKTTTVLFPLVYGFSSKYYKSFTVFPLFSKGKSPINKNKHLAFTPLFWHTVKNGVTRVNLVPLFSYKKDTLRNSSFSLMYFILRYKKQMDEKRLSFLWPLCEYKKDSAGKEFRFAPLVWFKNSDSIKYNAVLPFVYHSKTNNTKQLNILWQIYAHRNELGKSKMNSYLFKIVYTKKYHNKDFEYRFLYFVYVKLKKEGKKELTIFPFYQKYSDSASKYQSKSYFFSMYSKFKRGIPNTNKYYVEEKILWFIRLRSNYKTLKAQGIEVARKKLKNG